MNSGGTLTYAALAAAGAMVSASTTADEGGAMAMLDLYERGHHRRTAGALSVAGLLEADTSLGPLWCA